MTKALLIAVIVLIGTNIFNYLSNELILNELQRINQLEVERCSIAMEQDKNVICD